LSPRSTVYDPPVPYARLRSFQFVRAPTYCMTELHVSRLLVEGTIVDVAEPGAQRSYIELSGQRGLVDNSELEWLPEPARPSHWELLGGPGWVVG